MEYHKTNIWNKHTLHITDCTLKLFLTDSPEPVLMSRKVKHNRPKEGVIMVWPLNDLFNDSREVIISSHMAVSIFF